MSIAPRTWTLGACAAASLALAVVSGSEDAVGATTPAHPPLVTKAPTCASTAPLRRAEAREAEAEARFARYPFAPSEGVAALALLDEALACYARVGDEPGADRLGARQTEWRARIDADYRTQRLRLAQALAIGAGDLARESIDALLALLAGHDGPYTAWLRERALELDAERAEPAR